MLLYSSAQKPHDQSHDSKALLSEYKVIIILETIYVSEHNSHDSQYLIMLEVERRTFWITWVAMAPGFYHNESYRLVNRW